MTLPNKLTILRILLIPLMIIVYYIPFFKDNIIFLGVSFANFINCIIFIAASLTDMLDGKIARKYNLITTFGKFADPLADKMLVFSALILLCAENALSFAWTIPLVLIIIVIREFFVSGIRLVCVEKGKVIAASYFGKFKTVFQMIAIIVLFFFQINEVVQLVGTILLYFACLFTALSGIDYFLKNKESILESI